MNKLSAILVAIIIILVIALIFVTQGLLNFKKAANLNAELANYNQNEITRLENELELEREKGSNNNPETN